MGLLLDFRWPLMAALDDPDVSKVLIDFLELSRASGIRPTRFIDDQAVADFWLSIEATGHGRNQIQALVRFLNLCRYEGGSPCDAVTDPEPPRVTATWRRALRENLDAGEWRIPQIVVPKEVRGEWPATDEVNALCRPCGGRPSTGPHTRVLVTLERYAEHQFASSDYDPWDQSRLHPVENGRLVHRCLLPRPPCTVGVGLSNLHLALDEARSIGWHSQGIYAFVPAADFRPGDIDKATWRSGTGVFPRKRANGRGPGPVDFDGRVWVWDRAERHWDVQFPGGGYISISERGRKL